MTTSTKLNAVLGGTDDGRLRIHCPACKWDAVYTCLDLVTVEAVVAEHVAGHTTEAGVTLSTYPMTPADGFDEDDDAFDDEVLERVQQLAEDNPMPDGLRKQIMEWIEPQTVHTATDHEGAMDAVEIAYPLILAWHAERGAAA